MKIEHEGVVLLRVRPVQARERLHRLDAGERLSTYIVCSSGSS
jgi:hypothetical protein